MDGSPGTSGPTSGPCSSGLLPKCHSCPASFLDSRPQPLPSTTTAAVQGPDVVMVSPTVSPFSRTESKSTPPSKSLSLCSCRSSCWEHHSHLSRERAMDPSTLDSDDPPQPPLRTSPFHGSFHIHQPPSAWWEFLWPRASL